MCKKKEKKSQKQTIKEKQKNQRKKKMRQNENKAKNISKKFVKVTMKRKDLYNLSNLQSYNVSIIILFLKEAMEETVAMESGGLKIPCSFYGYYYSWNN